MPVLSLSSKMVKEGYYKERVVLLQSGCKEEPQGAN